MAAIDLVADLSSEGNSNIEESESCKNKSKKLFKFTTAGEAKQAEKIRWGFSTDAASPWGNSSTPPII